MRVITYEDFFSEQEVRIHKQMTRASMDLADIGRRVAAELVGGEIGDDGRSKKEFVITKKGRFRLSMSANSDNSTEQAAHDRMGVRRVVMGDERELRWFFAMHDLDEDVAYKVWLDRVKQRLWENE